MKLLSLVLENFQGIKNFTLAIDGKNASVYGDNGTGKTTLANANSWLLFDKPYTGAKNFTPKTKGPDGEDLHNLNHSAEGTYQLEDGSILNLKKIYKEVWTKTRGSNELSFSSHTIDYFIDGVPVQAKQYQDRIDMICKPEQAKMLTMPDYFSEQIHWQDRRNILLEICGDVSDDDVINSVKELQALREYLKKPGLANTFYTVEEYGKIASAKKAEINLELQTIPARIDEAKKAIPETSGTAEGLNSQILELQEKKKLLEMQMTGIGTSAELNALNEELSQAKAALAEANNLYVQNWTSSMSGKNAEIAKLREELSALNSEIFTIKSSIQTKSNDLEKMEAMRLKNVSEYTELQAKKWESSEKCYACGQALPESEVLVAKEKFNQTKSERLSAITADCENTCSKVLIAALKSEIEKAGNELGLQIEKKVSIEKLVEDIQNSIGIMPAFDNTSEHAELSAKIKLIESKIVLVGTDTNEAKSEIQGKINEFQRDIENLHKLKLNIQISEGQLKRISELEAQEKELASAYEDIQKGVFLCETFIRAKVSLLTNRINDKFENVRFRLFKLQVNGGVSEDCEVLVPTPAGLVPYSTANNAARINAGLELIETLGKHWNVSMPVMVDNAEAVTHLRSMQTQLIQLVVSEPDKTLRVVPE